MTIEEIESDHDANEDGRDYEHKWRVGGECYTVTSSYSVMQLSETIFRKLFGYILVNNTLLLYPENHKSLHQERYRSYI